MLLRSLFIFLFLGFAWSQPAKTETRQVILGDTTVVVEQVVHGSGKVFFHPHQNETTALKAANAVIQAEGGSVLTLRHPGARNIIFHLNGVRYEFDPNRMFTDKGIQKTLRQFGAYSTDAHQVVRKLADEVTMLLPKNQRVIAVHNNKSYSLREYYSGETLEKDAKALHVADALAYRNFFLVTQKSDYQRLKNLDYNILLQADSAEDDGSLSVYLASKPYVNVEAAYDALDAQIQMLKII